MDYANTRWIKEYLYDSAAWLRAGNAGRCVLLLLRRKLDRAGGVDVDPDPTERVKDVAQLVHSPEDFVQEGLAALLERKLLVLLEEGGRTRLVDPTFVEAQAAVQSGAQRVREHRARAKAPVADSNTEQPEVAPGNAEQREVTNVTSRVEEKRGEETRSEPPLSPQGAGEAGGQVNGVEALAAIHAAAKERLSFGKSAASATGLPAGDGKGSERAWLRAWQEQGQGYSLADCAKLGAWLAAGGWGHLQGSVSVAYLTGHLTEALQNALGWDGSPLGKARASPGDDTKPASKPTSRVRW